MLRKEGSDTLNSFILELDSLSYSINQKKLIDRISVKIAKGDIVSIIGPNGSGKSTLVKLISREILPSSGAIIFNGKNNNDWSASELALSRSALSQSSHLSFSFSVLDIIRMGFYPLEALGLRRNDDVINKLLKIFDLEGYSNRIYTTLSGGEQQRVQLARVIAQIWSEGSFEEKLLILDEPTSYLDIKHQAELFNYLNKLNKRGLTIVMVLHDINHAIQKSNKIIMLKNSRLIDYSESGELAASKKINEVFDIDSTLLYNKELTKPIVFLKDKERL